ncbi:MAG TPA: ATP-binding protein [Syntrophorhabdaceae bacterium]|nr:ATP-binding protein [Syntrophorhabdaceae bacterium]HOL05682.1 ATP-binding protein [Syntrophorhabdaceae bacterium]HPP42248.1 ATP-binding protein [Syntrophorhabdaceae bacterium]HQH42549.1 ATP-binding protein [Syntrophorhabdaceae bacterium]HRR71605.1 ATP-binding protein [Syntrophorhabdaceae bacterium]
MVDAMLNDSFRFTPHITLEFKIGEKDFFIAGESASRVKKTLQQLGMKQDIIKRTAIIIYEAAMNVAIHANHGTLKVYIDPEVISIITEDEGPGIPDIELAMKEGYSTASHEVREMGFGAGMGLPNIKQCSDELDIDTKVGVGTTLKAKICLNNKN